MLGRCWGKAKEMHEHSGPDSMPIKKIVREIVYLPPPDEIESIEDMCPNRRSKSPSCEAMGTEAADPVLKIKTAPVF
jgi:hypothetical protein